MMRFGVILCAAWAVQSAGASAQSALSADERQSFRQQVSACWNTGGLSDSAMKRSVTVTVELDRTAKPKAGTIRLVGAGKGTSAATLEAYTAAKRAVLRCGARGYKLPLEKYDQWKNIEMTFDPERTQTK